MPIKTKYKLQTAPNLVPRPRSGNARTGMPIQLSVPRRAEGAQNVDVPAMIASTSRLQISVGIVSTYGYPKRSPRSEETSGVARGTTKCLAAVARHERKTLRPLTSYEYDTHRIRERSKRIHRCDASSDFRSHRRRTATRSHSRRNASECTRSGKGWQQAEVRARVA